MIADPPTLPGGWDPIARDGHGAPVSAGELCQRDTCWHRWLDHDHAYAGLADPAFGACLIPTSDGRCPCPEFVGGDHAHIPPTPFAAPFPDPPRHARHE